MKKFILTKKLAKKVLDIVDCGLVSGLGIQEPGKFCVEAAVCYAMGLPHGDEPTCVSNAVRKLKIQLNDSNWSSNEARAKGLRRLAIAQLGSAGVIDDVAFAKEIARVCIEKVVPRALRHAAKVHPDKAHQEALEAAAKRCEVDQDKDAAYAANAAAAAARAVLAAAYAANAATNAARAVIAANAAAAAARAVLAAAYAANAANAASTANAALAATNAALAATNAALAATNAALAATTANAALAATDAANAAANPADADNELSLFAEDVVQVLILMKSPGCKFLNLTE